MYNKKKIKKIKANKRLHNNVLRPFDHDIEEIHDKENLCGYQKANQKLLK